MSPDEATDILFTLLSIEVYLLLIVSRGSTPAQSERWMVATLSGALLR
jgi:hypothetical protein